MVLSQQNLKTVLRVRDRQNEQGNIIGMYMRVESSHRRRDGLFNGSWKNGLLHGRKKIKLCLYHTPYTKINPSWIKGVKD